MANVKVAVRVRPPTAREVADAGRLAVKVEDKSVKIRNVKLDGRADGAVDSREKLLEFCFDYCYWSVDPAHPHYASQEEVFQDLGVSVLSGASEGYNVCLFAYGQTGSGKTYTMMGTPDSTGLTPRICQGLFRSQDICGEGQNTSRLEISFLEIYNERVRDLLRPPEQKKRVSLRVREHPEKGPYVQDLSQHVVTDCKQAIDLLQEGIANRITAATHNHDASSRSHAIFTIQYTQATLENNLPSEIVSKINLVDLAGSERADPHYCRDRLTEGSNINKSLVTLGIVISALAQNSQMSSSCQSINSMASEGDGSTLGSHSSSLSGGGGGGGGGGRRHCFIPYRDSVLTWLLKDSLGGNSKTIMIATVSPSASSYNETLSTLRYAAHARNIVNKPRVNEDANVRLIRELREEIDRLKSMLLSFEMQRDLSPSLSDERDGNLSDIVLQNELKVEQLTKDWSESWRDKKELLERYSLDINGDQALFLIKSLQPHLVSLDQDVLSTGVVFYHLREGVTLIGPQEELEEPQIVLEGNARCVIENHGGTVTLRPLPGGVCQLNGREITEPCRLAQGMVLTLGGVHKFRFNHPDEAAVLRERRRASEVGMSCTYIDLCPPTPADSTEEVKLQGQPSAGISRTEEPATWQHLEVQQRYVESLRQEIQVEQRRAEKELEREQAHLQQQHGKIQEWIVQEKRRLAAITQESAVQTDLFPAPLLERLTIQNSENHPDQVQEFPAVTVRAWKKLVGEELLKHHALCRAESRIRRKRLHYQLQRIARKRRLLEAKRELQRLEKALPAAPESPECPDMEVAAETRGRSFSTDLLSRLYPQNTPIFRHFLKRNRSSERTSNPLNPVGTRKWLSDECLPRERTQSCSPALLLGHHQTGRSSSENIRHTGKEECQAQPSRERPERKPLLPNRDLSFKKRSDQNATLSIKPPAGSAASKENVQGAKFHNIPGHSKVSQAREGDSKLESIKKSLSRSVGPRLKTALFKVFRKPPSGKTPQNFGRPRRGQSLREARNSKCALKSAVSCVELNRRTLLKDIGPRRWHSNEALMDKTSRWVEMQQGLSAWEEEEEGGDGDGDEAISDCDSLFSLDSLSSAYATALAEQLRYEEDERDSEDSQMSEDSLTVKSSREKSTVKRLDCSPCRPFASNPVSSKEAAKSQCQFPHPTGIVAKPRSPCPKAVEGNLSRRVTVENLQTDPPSGAPSLSSSSKGHNSSRSSSNIIREPEHLQALGDTWSPASAAESSRIHSSCLPFQKKEIFPNVANISSSSSTIGAASSRPSEGRVSSCNSTSTRAKGENAIFKGQSFALEATPQKSQVKDSPDKLLTGVACHEGQSEGLLDSESSHECDSKRRATQVKALHELTNAANVAPEASGSPVDEISTSGCPTGEISYALGDSSHHARAEGQCCLHAASSDVWKNNQKSELAGDRVLSSAWDDQSNGGKSEGGGERCGMAQRELVRSDCKNSRKRNKEQQDAFTGSLKMLKRSDGTEPAASSTAAVGSKGEIWLGDNSEVNSKGESSSSEQCRVTQHLLPAFDGPHCPKQRESECQHEMSAENATAVIGASVMLKTGAEEGRHDIRTRLSRSAAICSAIDLRISEVVSDHIRCSSVGGDDERKDADTSLKASSPSPCQNVCKSQSESQLSEESCGHIPGLLGTHRSVNPESCAFTSPEAEPDFNCGRHCFDVPSNGAGVDKCCAQSCVKNIQSDLTSCKESCSLILKTLNMRLNGKGFDSREHSAIKDASFQNVSQLIHQSLAFVSEEEPPPGGARGEGCSCSRVRGVSMEAVTNLKDRGCSYAKEITPIPILHPLKCLDLNPCPDRGDLQPKEHRTDTLVEANVSVNQAATGKDVTALKASIKKSPKPRHIVKKCVVNVRYSDTCWNCAAKASKESVTSRSEAPARSDSETNNSCPLKSEQKMTQDASFNQSVTSSVHTQDNVAAAGKKVKRFRRCKGQTGLTSSPESSLKSSDEDEEDSQPTGVRHSRPQSRCVSHCSQHSGNQEFTQSRRSKFDTFPKGPECRSENKTLEGSLDKVKTGQDLSKGRNSVLSKQATVEEKQQQPQQMQKPLDASMHFACSDINPFLRPWQDADRNQLPYKSPAFGSAADLSRKSPPLSNSGGCSVSRMARCCSVDDGLNGRDSSPFNSHLSAYAARRGLSSTLSSVEDGDREQVVDQKPQSSGSGRVDEIMLVCSPQQETQAEGVTSRRRSLCESGTQTEHRPEAAAAAPTSAPAPAADAAPADADAPPKRRERHRRSFTAGAATQRSSSSRSLKESLTWASMESMSAHLSKLIDSTSDLLEDVQGMRMGRGGRGRVAVRGRRMSGDLPAAAANDQRDSFTQTAVDVGIQTEKPSVAPTPSQHSVNLVVRVVAGEIKPEVPVAAQRRIRSASSRGSRRGAFTDRASSPILTVGVRRGSRPRGQHTHPQQRRVGNGFTARPGHQSEEMSVPQGDRSFSSCRSDSEISCSTEGSFNLNARSPDCGEKRRRSCSVSAKTFNMQSISPILRPPDDPELQVVPLRSLEFSVNAYHPSVSGSADLLQEDEAASPVPSECNTDVLVSMKPVSAVCEDNRVVPEDLPLHNKFTNWSGIVARPTAATHVGPNGAGWSEAEESLAVGLRSGRKAGEIERLRRERERLLATVGLGANPTPLSVELTEAKLHYGLGETDTLLKMLSVTPSCREEELLQASRSAATKQQLYERHRRSIEGLRQEREERLQTSRRARSLSPSKHPHPEATFPFEPSASQHVQHPQQLRQEVIDSTRIPGALRGDGQGPSDIEQMLRDYSRAREEARTAIARARERLRERTEQEKRRLQQQVVSQEAKDEGRHRTRISSSTLCTGSSLSLSSGPTSGYNSGNAAQLLHCSGSQPAAQISGFSNEALQARTRPLRVAAERGWLSAHNVRHEPPTSAFEPLMTSSPSPTGACTRRRAASLGSSSSISTSYQDITSLLLGRVQDEVRLASSGDLSNLLSGKASAGWRYQGLERGIQAFYKPSSSLSVHSFLGVGELDRPVESVWSFVCQLSRSHVFNQSVRSVWTRPLDDSTQLVYILTDPSACHLSQPRDFCCISVQSKQAGLRTLAMQSVFEESLPRPSVDAVRGEMMPSGWLLQPVRRSGREATRVTFLLQVDLGTPSFPQRLLGAVARRQAAVVADLDVFLSS